MTEFILKPKAIKPGDTIGVISPASRPLDDEKFDRGIDYLQKMGYNVIEAPHSRNRYGFLAGTDAERAADLNDFFADPEIDAIICSRGGYGTPRIIDLIDFELIRKNPKIFIGYSDITALQLAIWEKTRLITFSGPMVAVEMGAGIEPFTEKSLWQKITGEENYPKLFESPSGEQVEVVRSGKASGRLLGGCLSLINTLLGTEFCPHFEGAIFFIEDIDEEPYHLDRYLAQMRLSGIFEKIAGLVLGKFVDCEPDEPDKPYLSIGQIFDDFFGDLKIPIIKNFPYGHVPVKHTMPIGAEVELDTEKGGLILLEPPVQTSIA